MSLVKRVSGDFTIETISGSNGSIILRPDPSTAVIIDGNLTVTGDQTSINTTNTNIVDNVIVLNSGEQGAGISALTAGLEVDRGTLDEVGLRYNESLTRWEATDDGTSWYSLATGIGGGLGAVVDDTDPHLGGDLVVNGYSITSESNGDIVLVADGTGLIRIEQELSLKEQLTDETPVVGYNKIYAKVPGPGGSGLYVSNMETTDELVSKKKAIVYSIIF